MQVYYQLLPKYRCNNFAFVSTSKPVQAYYSSDRYSKKVNEVPPKKYRVSHGLHLGLHGLCEPTRKTDHPEK